jgi:hypothetical protein
VVEPRWRVRLGAAAELDFANILKGTSNNDDFFVRSIAGAAGR